MEIFLHTDAWIALLTLTFLELVLGIDNIIFISILTNKLPLDRRKKVRLIGLSLALAFRIILLLSITWVIQAKSTLFTLFDLDFSYRDLIMICGGLFLLAKSTSDIYSKVEGFNSRKKATFRHSTNNIILQIVLLDIIFSFDSILTAIGLTDELLLMIIAVSIAMVIMMFFAKLISEFIEKNPSLQILALAFLILIGFMITIEGFDYHIPKGYLYFALLFSLMVEALNVRIKNKENVKMSDHHNTVN